MGVKRKRMKGDTDDMQVDEEEEDKMEVDEEQSLRERLRQ